MSNIFHSCFNSTVNLCHERLLIERQFICKVKGKEIKQYFSA